MKQLQIQKLEHAQSLPGTVWSESVIKAAWQDKMVYQDWTNVKSLLYVINVDDGTWSDEDYAFMNKVRRGINELSQNMTLHRQLELAATDTNFKERAKISSACYEFINSWSRVMSDQLDKMGLDFYEYLQNIFFCKIFCFLCLF